MGRTTIIFPLWSYTQTKSSFAVGSSERKPVSLSYCIERKIVTLAQNTVLQTTGSYFKDI